MKTLTLFAFVSIGSLTACGGGSTPAPRTPAPPQFFQEDASATPELRTSMQGMLAAMDAGDVDGVTSRTAPEGWKLPSYDLDADGNPTQYSTPADAKATLEAVTAQLRHMGAKLQTTVNAFDCQGTPTFAVCAADLVQAVNFPQGASMPAAGRITAAARKGSDGWKWTHWHISLAQPSVPPPQPPAAPPPAPPPLLPIVAVNTKDLTWKDAKLPGTQEAVAWENPATHESVVFMKVGKPIKVPRHFHSAATHGFVVKGGLTVTDAAGKAHEVTPGGWYYEPARVVHSIDVKAGTIVLHITSGPFDTVMVDDQGNPIVAPAPAPSGDKPASEPSPAPATAPSAQPTQPAK